MPMRMTQFQVVAGNTYDHIYALDEAGRLWGGQLRNRTDQMVVSHWQQLEAPTVSATEPTPDPKTA